MPADERRGQAAVPLEPHDVMHAVGARHVRRAVRRPVVDDQVLDDVDARAARAADRPASPAASRPRSGTGIWMMSFVMSSGAREPVDDAGPGDAASQIVTLIAHARAGLRRSASSVRMASASACGSGAVTQPLTPSVTNSLGPPASVVVTTGLCDRNASSVT